MDEKQLNSFVESGRRNAANNAKTARSNARRSAMSNLDKLSSQQKTNSALTSVKNRFSGVTRGGGVDPTMMYFAMQAKQDADAAKSERETTAKQQREEDAVTRRQQFFG